MHELQSDDLFIPDFLLKLLPQPKNDRRETHTEDFLKSVQGWTEFFPVDECVE
jgi:hypothetical protein